METKKKFKRAVRKVFKFVYYTVEEQRLNKAIRMADEAKANNGQRHFVIKGAGRKLVIIDRAMMKRLRRKNLMNKNVRVIDLLQECYYCTPDRSGRQPSEKVFKMKRKQYHEDCNNL